ncbi:GTP-binding protein 1 [Pseudoneurospora amorphoporcata]|uniref:GTP-binding protein 1 n=1 Tax=Pseudoneurospora amorphoporcata TaxID=241081 RepID=A0AAN6SG22_9PEZI|nr:GTP-binding protein 1 [Pseudoneurospora amorphoporcata]
MASKQAPHERRKGEAALCDFAEYVERQQALRYPNKADQSQTATTAAAAAAAGAGASSTTVSPTNDAPDQVEHHAELDDILDSLNLSEPGPRIRLRDLLLSAPNDDGSLQRLADIVSERLDEGHGESVFDIGFENHGESMKLTKDDWEVAYKRLSQAAAKIGADCQLLLTKNLGGHLDGTPTRDGDVSGKVMIRRRPSAAEEVIETRIAVVGNVDAGKSSMLGVLVKGDLDDGRGCARVNLFRHKHEIETGRTSSVGMEIMGFDSHGQTVLSDTPGRKLSWEEIGKRSAKVITFTDLAGHERYLRTTVFGLLSSSPNYCLLMVAANNGLIGMSKEHLGIALALNVPIMVVITKIDICPPNILEQTITQITRILKSPGARKIPIFIKSREECINTATQFVSQRICPIFQVSNVTGENLDLVRAFLNILPHHGRYDADAPFEFHVNDTFSVPHVGTVVSGIVKSGVIHAGDEVYLGPDGLGKFTTTAIRSIERKRIGVPAASAGQSASFALKRVKRKDVRKGMVVLSKTAESGPPKVYREFVAEGIFLSVLNPLPRVLLFTTTTAF